MDACGPASRPGGAPPAPVRLARWRAGTVALLVSVAAAACATYSDRMRAAADAAGRGDYTAAVASLNKALGVGSADELPDRWGGNRPLVALERGTLAQALERFTDSQRDFTAAEQEIELLDFSADAIGALGKYLYSDSARKYRAPPSERLALNTFNLLNYLTRGDLQGAAVEARRFTVMREYLGSEGVDATRPAALGAYLSGVVFEQLGEGDRALRYYDEALAPGDLPSLVPPVQRLAAANPYRGPHLKRLLASVKGSAPRNTPPGGELLIVVALGRVPHKVPERIPIGAAIALAGAFATSDWKWLEYGVAKVLVFPGLAETPSLTGDARVHVDGEELPLDLVADLAAAVRAEYEAVKPVILAAALTRMAARAAVAEGARAAGGAQSNELGAVAAILTEAVLVALDRPDTRSWAMLPGRVQIARLPVPPGLHRVEVRIAGGAARDQDVIVPDGGLATVVVTEPR